MDAPDAGTPGSAPPHAALRERFRAALERAAGRLLVVEDEDAAREAIASLAEGGAVVRAAEEPSEEALRAAAVGVDDADVLIAETGSVVRSFGAAAAARVSLVPPVAVFLARPETLVPTLGDALKRVADTHRAGRRTTAIVTGPSRTADIEKRLVIPAHGPRALVVILVEDGPGA